MNRVNRIALTVAAGSAPSPYTNRELLKAGGLHTKALLAARLAPRLVTTAINTRIATALINEAERITDIDPCPTGHGWESIIYATRMGDVDGVAKVGYPRLHRTADKIAGELRKTNETYAAYLGPLVVDTEIITFPSPFDRSARLLGILQPRVEGTCITDPNANADPDALRVFGSRSLRMLDEIGCIPDVCGQGNVLVGPKGAITLVDTGAPVPPGRWDFRQNVTFLRTMASPNS